MGDRDGVAVVVTDVAFKSFRNALAQHFALAHKNADDHLAAVEELTDAQAVVDYDADWDAKENRGSFSLKLASGKRTRFQASDGTEFIAILTLLQGEKTIFAKPPLLTTKS